MARLTIQRPEIEAYCLPSLCAYCGGRDAQPVELTLPYVRGTTVARDDGSGQVIAHLAAPVVGLWAIIILMQGLFTERQFPVLLPLCETHAQTARRRAWLLRFGKSMLSVLAVIALLAAVTPIAQAIQAGLGRDDLFLWSTIYLLPAFICTVGALLCRARLYDGFIFLVSVDEQQFVLGGVAPAFVLACSSGSDVHGLPWDAIDALRPEQVPRRATLLNRVGITSLLVSFCLMMPAFFVPVVAADKKAMQEVPGAAFVFGTALFTLCMLPIPLAVWLVARKDLASMKAGLCGLDGKGTTEVAFLQGRFAAIMMLIELALAGLPVIILLFS